MYICMHVYAHACLNVGAMYTHLHVHVCMYVCMYVHLAALDVPQRRFIFEETELELIPTCAVNITMPGPKLAEAITTGVVVMPVVLLEKAEDVMMVTRTLIPSRINVQTIPVPARERQQCMSRRPIKGALQRVGDFRDCCVQRAQAWKAVENVVITRYLPK